MQYFALLTYFRILILLFSLTLSNGTNNTNNIRCFFLIHYANWFCSHLAMSATTLSPSKALTGSGPSRPAKEIFAEIQAKFRLEQAEFVRLYKGTNSGDVISLEEFIRITKSLWIHLEKSEIEFISANFASGIDSKLNWTKFVKKLDILPPDDYSEPDRFLDPLPEPLAGIIEILEVVYLSV